MIVIDVRSPVYTTVVGLVAFVVFRRHRPSASAAPIAQPNNNSVVQGYVALPSVASRQDGETLDATLLRAPPPYRSLTLIDAGAAGGGGGGGHYDTSTFTLQRNNANEVFVSARYDDPAVLAE